MFYKFTFNVYFHEANDRCIISVAATDKDMASAKVKGMLEDTLDYIFNLVSVEEINHDKK